MHTLFTEFLRGGWKRGFSYCAAIMVAGAAAGCRTPPPPRVTELVPAPNVVVSVRSSGTSFNVPLENGKEDKDAH